MDMQYAYEERMLQIADKLPERKLVNAGRLSNRRHYIREGYLNIWRECVNLQEFAERSNLSIGKAGELHKLWKKLYGDHFERRTSRPIGMSFVDFFMG